MNGSALYFNSPVSATIRAAQAGNDNYLPASVDRLSSVTLPSFESLFGGQTANSDANGDGVPALAEYALGGSTNSNNLGILPSLSTNTNRLFTLTAIVRTNDPKLSILPVVSTNLGTNNWTNAFFITNTPTNQVGVPSGFARKEFTYTNTNSSRAFLRLSVSNAP